MSRKKLIGQVTIIGLLMCLCTMSGIKTDDRLHFCQILSQMMGGQSYDGHRAGPDNTSVVQVIKQWVKSTR